MQFNTQKILGLSIAGLTALFTGCKEESEKTSDASENPNIILINADDLGYGDLGCYGQEVLSTPHIDEMASEGIMFTNHYCGSTVSAPTRASLLTGKHTGHTSVRANEEGQLLRDEETTIAEKMKEAGYITGAIGKWGVGHPPPVDDPERKGFDFFYGYLNMWHAHNYYPEFLYRNGEKEYLEGNKLITEDGKNPWADKPEGTGVAEKKEQYAHDLFDKEALQFIEENRDTTFFLYLPYNIPHANNEAGRYHGNGMEVPDYGPFANKDWPDPEKGFAAMIRKLDNSVGMINKKLSDLGINKNTLVIFVSDNGPHQEGEHKVDFFNSNGNLRGMKRDLYEGGIKVPFIAKWPQRIKPGRSSDHISAFWDILPTLCEVADVEPPKATDGISFFPTLEGKHEEQKQHEYLYWEFYARGGKQAVRREKWKAIRLNTCTDNPKPIELYNLSIDPSEENNVANNHPEIVEEMKRIMKEAHDPLPEFSLKMNW
ncbi:MAG: arylsulfatase [Bacteroidales bacterium]